MILVFVVQVDDAFVSNINRIYYWNIDNVEDFLYSGAIPQVIILPQYNTLTDLTVTGLVHAMKTSFYALCFNCLLK